MKGFISLPQLVQPLVPEWCRECPFSAPVNLQPRAGVVKMVYTRDLKSLRELSQAWMESSKPVLVLRNQHGFSFVLIHPGVETITPQHGFWCCTKPIGKTCSVAETLGGWNGSL